MLIILFLLLIIIVVSAYSGGRIHELSSKLEQVRTESSSAVSELPKKENQFPSSSVPTQRVNVTSSQTIPQDNQTKVAYLTFDDGPSQYTSQLLDTLKSNNIHATFFVVGTNVVNREDVIKREYAERNAVGIHCWSHEYSVCYASPNAFFSDFNHIKSTLTNLLGVSPNVCRFPGGTGNTVSDKYSPHFMQQILPEITDMGIKPFDWDVDAGDADSVPATTQKVISTVIKEAKVYNHPVILCHEKKNTVAAIPSIIAQLKALGYTFDVLSPNAPSCLQKPV